jgi:hypothetical protein
MNAQMLDRPVYSDDGTCGITVVIDDPSRLSADKAQLDRLALTDLYPDVKNAGEIYELGAADNRVLFVEADDTIVKNPEAMGYVHMLGQAIYDTDKPTIRNAGVQTNIAYFGKPNTDAKKALLDTESLKYRELAANPEQATTDVAFNAYDRNGTLISVAQGSSDIFAINTDDARRWLNDDGDERPCEYKLVGAIDTHGEITGLGAPENGLYTANVQTDGVTKFPHFTVGWDNSRNPALVMVTTLEADTDDIGDDNVVRGRGFQPDQLAIENRRTGAFTVVPRTSIPALTAFGRRTTGATASATV